MQKSQRGRCQVLLPEAMQQPGWGVPRGQGLCLPRETCLAGAPGSPLPPPAVGEPHAIYPRREEEWNLGAILLLQSVCFLIYKEINCRWPTDTI